MKLLDYILYFNYTKILLWILNISSFFVVIQEINEPLKIRKKINKKDQKIFKTQLIISLLAMLLTCIILLKKYSAYILTFFLIFFGLNFLVKLFNKNYQFNVDRNIIYILSAAAFIIFFSNNMINYYIQIFQNIPHFFKEILLVIFIVLKVLLFLYNTIFNILVILSIISEFSIVNKIWKNLHNFFFQDHFFYFKFYDYNFYRKRESKLAFTLDTIIFIILIFPTLFYNLISIFLFKIFYKILRLLMNQSKKIYLLYINKNQLNKIINILLIFTLIITYISMILSKEIFSNEIIEICNIIFTVILIPLIWDQINSLNKN